MVERAHIRCAPAHAPHRGSRLHGRRGRRSSHQLKLELAGARTARGRRPVRRRRAVVAAALRGAAVAAIGRWRRLIEPLPKETGSAPQTRASGTRHAREEAWGGAAPLRTAPGRTDRFRAPREGPRTAPGAARHDRDAGEACRAPDPLRWQYVAPRRGPPRRETLLSSPRHTPLTPQRHDVSDRPTMTWRSRRDERTVSDYLPWGRAAR